VTLNLEENVSYKKLISFDTKLLRTQRLVSDARRNVRLYNDQWSKISTRGKSTVSPHGTNFFTGWMPLLSPK